MCIKWSTTEVEDKVKNVVLKIIRLIQYIALPGSLICLHNLCTVHIITHLSDPITCIYIKDINMHLRAQCRHVGIHCVYNV